MGNWPNVETQFKPGHPGGPGRPPGETNYRYQVDRWILEEAMAPSDIDGLSKGRRIIQRIVDDAAAGKVAAQKMWIDTAQSTGFLERLEEYETRGRKRDLSFLRYMIDQRCFDEQKELLRTHKPMTVMIGGRRAGKTIGFAALLSDRSIVHEKGVALYLGRTAKSAFEMIWRPTIETLELLGIPFDEHLTTQIIAFPNGVEIQVRGRATREDVENLRGKAIFLAIVDEIQSDPAEKLRYIVEDILEPAGKDFEDSEIALGGTPPRVPGNYAEQLYFSPRKDIKRLNWNLSVNPHIPKSERDLEKTRVEKGFSPTDPTWQREYLGVVGSYDVEALVLKLQAANHYAETDFKAWIDSQPITDIFFSGGIDYGFDDYNSAVLVMASESKGERFLLAEYKGHRQSTSDFGNEIKRLAALVQENPLLSKIPDKRWTWFCDTEGLGKQLTHDLASMYSLSVQPAYQGQQDLMVEMLQDDIKNLRFKCHEKQVVSGAEIVGPFEQETYKIVFARDEIDDHLTRRIDDEAFHPEIMRSVLYAMRYVWMKTRVKPGGTK